MIVLVIDKNGKAEPAYPDDAEALAQLRPGHMLVAEEKTKPSAQMRAFYWSLLGFICQNHTFYNDKDLLNDSIKFGIGYIQIRMDHKGNLIPSLKSNAEIERTYSEYKEFCNKAFDYINTAIMEGQAPQLIAMVEERLGLSWKDIGKKQRSVA